MKLKAVINEHSNDQITVPFFSFEIQKLTAVKRDGNGKFIINFIDELLPVIINLNML